VALLKKKSRTFDMQIQDMVLRITAPIDFEEESRAAALQFWEQLHSYSVRNPKFGTSKRPVDVPDDAPQIVKGIAEISGRAGVGPVFTFQGAVIDYVGDFLAQSLDEVSVSSGGDFYVLTKRRQKLTISHPEDGEGMSVVIDPANGPQGVYTTVGRRKLPAETVDGLAVVATSCTYADAAAAAILAILRKPNSFEAALAHLREMDGVFGGVVIVGERIGVAGAVEIAA
jgi:ApbE superfamily uncharacterized protein (UPF0280 family)